MEINEFHINNILKDMEKKGVSGLFACTIYKYSLYFKLQAY